MIGGTYHAAPWHDTEWEIWGLPWISYPRIDRFYEIHEEAFYTGPHEKRDAVMARNRERFADVPVYCTETRAHAFPKPVPYPMQEVLESLPFAYLEDSVAYMIAHAIHEGVTDLGLFGVHQMGSDYGWHRPSVTYLTGLAQGRGINVIVPPGSPLFMSRYMMGRYGITVETRC